MALYIEFFNFLVFVFPEYRPKRFPWHPCSIRDSTYHNQTIFGAWKNVH